MNKDIINQITLMKSFNMERKMLTKLLDNNNIQIKDRKPYIDLFNK